MHSCNLTNILIIPEYYVPLHNSAFEQVLLPGDIALYKCFLLLLLLFELLLLLIMADSVYSSRHYLRGTCMPLAFAPISGVTIGVGL